MDEVGCGVGGRERHGDDEVGGSEAEEREDEEFATPLREEAFEHGDAALAVWTGLGDACVEGQRSKEGDEDQNQGGEGGEHAGGEEGDAGLIAEGGEVVDACEAHDCPPGMDGIGSAVHAFGQLQVSQKPIG